MILKQDLYKTSPHSFNNTDETEISCEIFSNIEQLQCRINNRINKKDVKKQKFSYYSKYSLLKAFYENIENYHQLTEINILKQTQVYILTKTKWSGLVSNRIHDKHHIRLSMTKASNCKFAII
jgi:hypothetical protein